MMYTKESILLELKEASKKTGRKQFSEAMIPVRAHMEVFNKEAFKNAMENATIENAIALLLPKEPKKEEKKDSSFTYRKQENNEFTYQVFDETGKLVDRKVKFIDFMVYKAVYTGLSEKQVESLLKVVEKYDSVVESLVNTDTDKIEGVNDLKIALQEIVNAFNLATVVKGGLTVNKSIIRASLKTASGINNKGEIETFESIFDKLARAVKKAENEPATAKKDEHIRKAKERRDKASERFYKIIFSFIAKAIALKARNINNISFIRPEAMEEIEKAIA